jgi:hypothetical protein
MKHHVSTWSLEHFINHIFLFIPPKGIVSNWYIYHHTQNMSKLIVLNLVDSSMLHWPFWVLYYPSIGSKIN